MKNKFPEHIMRILRQRRGLKEQDARLDGEINGYKSRHALSEVLTWEFGHRGWLEQIKGWADSCGVQIKFPDESKHRLK